MEVRRVTRASERGFGLIDAMVAMILLLIGLVSMLSMFAVSIATMQFSQEEMIARQKAREMVESIYTARNTQQIRFDMISNASSGGIFVDGFQPLRIAGTDGLVGTDDDGAVETVVLPGPDGIQGTGDDEVRTLDLFEREARIASVSDKLRQVTVTVRYRTPQGWQRSYEIQSYVSAFR